MPIGFETANDDTTCLASAADRLRAVRLAHGRFLALWAADHLLAGGNHPVVCRPFGHAR